MTGLLRTLSCTVAAMTSRSTSLRGIAAALIGIGAAVMVHAGTLTVLDQNFAGNPDILAYNLAHFYPGSNTHDWWRYSGVNGARLFISPSSVEPSDDIPGTGDGVTNQAGFLSRKTALRADPLNHSFIDWPDFEDEYENKTLGGNRIRINYALGKLRELDIQVLAQITAGEGRFPISGSGDWAGKWELWQHFYAQAFHLGRHFDVARYQMFNEPNHPNAGELTASNWLMRLQLVSDAIQSALADVNTLYGKSLESLVFAPVNSGGDGPYSGWGDLAVANRHVNFLGVSDPGYLVMHRYDYHEYNSTPSQFASSLNSLRSSISADMAPETRFPMSISEFNVHTNSNFNAIPETLDDPVKYARLGAIAVHLIKNFEKELYCFKFGQTEDNAATYGVKKNGMHYVHNSSTPYDTGGATRAAEVWRLVNKGMKPGGTQKKYTRDSNGSIDDLDLRATYRPATGNYHVYSANNTGSGVSLTVDTSAWNIPAGSRYLLEEVSTTRYGSVRTWNTVSADGTLFDGTDNLLWQPARTVWLFTIAAKPQQAQQIIDASEDATVIDGSNAGTNYAGTSTLLARNDPATADNRKAAFIKFTLPVVHPPDIQLAVLSLRGKTNTADTTAQGHLYGLDDDSWTAGSLTWSNAPNLRKGAAPGDQIEDRVITGQGDSAHILGQIVVTSTSRSTKMLDVTDFLQSQPGSTVSFLLTQDPRWDVALPALTSGDIQADGLDIRSSEAATQNSPGPQLKIVTLADTDGDGISDEAETNTFLSDPDLPDTDGDGQTDGQEVLAGSDPNDPASMFAIDSLERIGGGSVRIEWPSVTGRSYTLWRSTTLQPGDWTAVHVAPGTGVMIDHTDPAAAGLTEAFYRLQVQ